MDFIYSRLNNNLVDINRIESINILKCEIKDDPIKGLEIGDYYLKVTVVDSDRVVYCDMSDLNADEQSLLNKIYEEQQRAIARENEIENVLQSEINNNTGRIQALEHLVDPGDKQTLAGLVFEEL